MEWKYTEGISLRDYFAAQALQGMLSANTEASDDDLAKYAYSAADAMLAARDQRADKLKEKPMSD